MASMIALNCSGVIQFIPFLLYIFIVRGRFPDPAFLLTAHLANGLHNQTIPNKEHRKADSDPERDNQSRTNVRNLCGNSIRNAPQNRSDIHIFHLLSFMIIILLTYFLYLDIMI